MLSTLKNLILVSRFLESHFYLESDERNNITKYIFEPKKKPPSIEDIESKQNDQIAENITKTKNMSTHETLNTSRGLNQTENCSTKEGNF